MKEQAQIYEGLDVASEMQRLAAIKALIDSVRPVAAELDRHYGFRPEEN